MKKIYYLCYFDIPEHTGQQRNFVLSAVTKSDYIAKSFVKAGYEVEIVSASGTCGKNFCSGSVTQLDENLSLRLFDAKPAGNAVQRVFARRFLKKQLKSYLLENVTKNDILLIYHSLGYMDLVKELHSKTDCRICLDIEEIYGDVINNEKIKEKEIDFFSCADSYLFPTELLSRTINSNGKPEAVVYGTYEKPKALSPIFNDGKTHCVYAGVLEPRKGAGRAIAAAEFLPENYHVHIIGFGREEDIAEIKKQIAEISVKTECTVSFDGQKSGDEYLQFLQSCQIGFVTQNADAAFNETSFPSKVLSYLSNGLRVVSVRIKAIETSKVADILYFYDGENPQEVADAILKIDFSDGYDSREKIEVLDADFVYQIRQMIV